MHINTKSLELLKWVAILLMFLDHLAYISNSYTEFRLIGRWCYPCFAFLLAYNSINRTNNILAYANRLFIIGIISQPIYFLVFSDSHLNIMFSLGFSLLGIYFIKERNYLPLILTSFLLYFCSYGLATIFLIYGFYFFLSKSINKFISVTLIFLGLFYLNSQFLVLQLTTLLFPLFLLFILWIGKFINIIRVPKYFGYLFYPSHLLLIYLWFI